MYGLQIVGFGLSCPDLGSSVGMRALSIGITFALAAAFFFVTYLAARSLQPKKLRYAVMALFLIISIVVSPLIFFYVALSIECGPAVV
ncbi:MAG: hypothetical protein V4678_03670 [Patescibacteria group bacterium]